MENLRRDLSTAIRRIARAPVGFICQVGAFAVALGVGTTLFSFFSAQLLRWSDVESSHHVRVGWVGTGGELGGAILPAEVTSAILAAQPFESVQLGGYRRALLAVSFGSESLRVSVLRIAGDYFSVLGAQPVAGRLISADETDGHPIVVLSTRLVHQLGVPDAASALGQTITVAGQPRTVVGVIDSSARMTAPEFGRIDAWMPANAEAVAQFIGRLAPGRSVTQATAELQSATRSVMDGRDRELAIRPGLSAVPAAAYLAGSGVVAFGLVVAAVATASILNLLLAGIGERRRELGVRLMLGASAGDIRRLLTAEALIVVAAGGALAILMAPLASEAIQSILPVRNGFTWNLDLSPDWRVALFGFLVTATIASGTAMALARAAASTDALSALTGASTATPPGRMLRSRLIAAQVAGCAFLLVVGGLFVQSAAADLGPESGLRSDVAMTGWIDFESQGIEQSDARATEFTLLESLAASPALREVGLGTDLPGSRRIGLTARSASDDRRARAYVTGVTAGYQDAADLALTRGRWLTPAEVRGADAVVVIDERGASALFGDQDPVGRTVTLSEYQRPPMTYRVVGVVQDANVPAGLPQTQFFAYLPLTLVPSSRVVIVARGPATRDEAMRALKSAVQQASPGLALYDVMPLRDALGLGRAFLRLLAVLILAMSLVGITIAFVGLYGVVAIFAGQRRREFAVRAALGATTGALCRMLASEGLRLMTGGIAAGMGAGFLVTVLLRRRFWELPALDWTTLAVVPAVLIALGLVASVLPLHTVGRRPLSDTLRAGQA